MLSRHDRADAVDLRQPFDRGVIRSSMLAEFVRQQVGHAVADVRDASPASSRARPRPLLASMPSSRFCADFLPMRSSVDELVERQPIQVRDAS